MRTAVLLAGWALVVTAIGFTLAGISAAAPHSTMFGMSAAEQTLAQQWLLVRGFPHLMLGFSALLSAFAAFILVRQMPYPGAEAPDDLRGNIYRIAVAVEALRRDR